MARQEQIFLTKSLYAGILIGLGDVIYLSVDNKIIGALLFSLGLLAIINQQLNLYTGKIGFICFDIKHYAFMLLCNMVGVVIPPYLMYFSDTKFQSTMINMIDIKSNKPIYIYLIAGILCGICMYVAVSSKREIITIFAIMVFILSRYEHCVADTPYLLGNINMLNILRLIFAIIGNSIGSIGLYLLSGDYYNRTGE